MKNLITAFAFLTIASVTFAHDNHEDAKITSGKILELTTHRIDRLVVTKKVDANFLKRLEKIQVTQVENQSPVFYKVLASQTAPQQGQPLQLEITFDKTGKFVGHRTVEGGALGADPKWTAADAQALLESAFHYVLDNTANRAIEPYFLTMSEATLSKTQLKGSEVALIKIKATAQAQALNIYLKLDGKFISYEIVP